MAHIKKSSIIIFIALSLLIPALFITISGLLDIKSAVILTVFGETVSAEVTSHRIRKETDKNIHELKYQFSVDDKSYTSPDGQWINLPAEQWEEAVERQTIQILYMKDDPEVNHPLYVEDGTFVNNASRTGLALLVSVICGIAIIISLHPFSHETRHGL